MVYMSNFLGGMRIIIGQIISAPKEMLWIISAREGALGVGF